MIINQNGERFLIRLIERRKDGAATVDPKLSFIVHIYPKGPYSMVYKNLQIFTRAVFASIISMDYFSDFGHFLTSREYVTSNFYRQD